MLELGPYGIHKEHSQKALTSYSSSVYKPKQVNLSLLTEVRKAASPTVTILDPNDPVLRRHALQPEVLDISTSLPSEESLVAWGNTSDPMQHNPSNFRYLVHAFKPWGMQPNFASTEYGDQTILLIDEPERVAEKVSLSMSFINQDHTATFGVGGLLMDAPTGNILLNSPTDLRTPNADIRSLEERSMKEPLLPPDDLLEQTDGRTYNEIVARARSAYGEIRLKGFFVKVDANEQYLDADLAEKLGLHASRLGLPLIKIEEAGVDK